MNIVQPIVKVTLTVVRSQIAKSMLAATAGMVTSALVENKLNKFSKRNTNKVTEVQQ